MLQVGQVLQERYQLKQQFGQNAGRQTWLAEDLAKQPIESVIVKLLAFGDQIQWDSLKLFEREANLLRQLNHPRIPKYRDYFSINDRTLWFGLVQDYIPGLSLKQLLDRGQKFSEAAVRKIATEVLQILIYLHELSPAVLHRDIKPSNLILGKDKHIYLVDFGAGQDRARAEGATFTVVGTYGYAPMEQFGGRAVPASDLYALGATLIHLITGISPADLPQQNMRIQFSDRVSLSPSFVRCIERLTHPDVQERFSSARQAIQAIQSNQTEPTFSSPVVQSNPQTKVQLNKSAARLEIVIPSRLNPPLSTPQPANSPTHYPGAYNQSAFLGCLVGCLAIFGAIVLLPLFIILLPLIIFFIPFIFIYVAFIIVKYSSESKAINKYLECGYRVCLDKNEFVIERCHSDKTISKTTELTAKIRTFYQDTAFKAWGRNVKCIAIEYESGGKALRKDIFGHGLTEPECQWLIKEIKEWLQFRSKGVTEAVAKKQLSNLAETSDKVSTNRTSRQSFSMLPPHGSRIKLKKSSSQLEIKLPINGIRAANFGLILFLLLWFGFTIAMTVPFVYFPIAWLFMLIGLIPGLLGLISLLLSVFGEIYVYFNSNYFIIKRHSLGQCYKNSKGKTSAIHDVGKNIDVSESSDGQTTTRIMVTIKADTEEYKFGAFAPTLTEVEIDWLVGEIKEWLALIK